MSKKLKVLFSAVISMMLIAIIVPCAFAEDATVYTTTDVTGGVRIDSVETTEKILVIPDEIDGKAVVELAPKAFTETVVEEITIPATVTKMYGYYSGYDSGVYSALYGMEYLTKVTFSDGMRTVPENALENCTTVTEVVLPESLATISDKAFFDCTALKTINLPDSITSISNEAFNGCSALSKIDLPDELVTLGSMAFANCTNIDEITLPENLATIGTSAFLGTKISEITIPANVTSMYSWYSGRDSYYSYSALDSMEYLTKVNFSDGMRTVPENALNNCTTITEVVLPESLTTISEKAFCGCTALTTISLPDSVTSISDAVFNGCSSLSEIDLPDELVTLGSMAFANCTKIDEITLPENLTAIGTSAFLGTKISEITIPANVTSMYSWYSGRDSYYSYSALDSMEYLTKVTFADGMREIPTSALYGCSYVKEVILPETLTTISDEAFYGCSALTIINLPDSITFVGDSAFNGCLTLSEIDLPDELVTLGSMAFANCTKIAEITLSENLTTIGTSAFLGTKISEITIPANVTSMYSWYSGRDSYYSYSALDSMEYLTKVTFADGMRVIPENALYECLYIKEVVVYDCNTSVDSLKETVEANGFTVTVLECAECNHAETIIKNAVAANCTTAGYTGDTHCANCDMLISAGEEIPATGHSFGDWTVVTAATTTEEGVEERVCSSCDEKETRSIEKLEDNSLVVKAESEIVVDNENMQTTIEINSTYADVIAQIENENVVITNADGETITADTAIGTGCVIIINNIVQYNIVINYDVDGNGKITAADARLALRASAQIDKLEGVYAQAANVDGNDTITAADARQILRKSAGLE